MPLVAKLGIAPKERWLLVNAPKGFEAALDPLPEGASTARTRRGGVDGAIFFVKERAMLARSVGRVQEGIAQGGALWIAWPKRVSGVPTDVTKEAVREVVLPTGWASAEARVLDETWSALRFLRRAGP